MNWCKVVWLLAWISLPTLAGELPLQLALRGTQHDQLYQLTPSGVASVSTLPDTLSTPLGSLWKLYVYAWLEDTHQPEQPYQCQGKSPEEVYCCQAGESITRDTALVRSCGLYFAPQRLHIRSDVWEQYWQQRQSPTWITSLTTLKPETSVTVKSLLDSLATLPAQNKAQEILLDVLLDDSKMGVASMLGSRVRVKTWSWFADDKQEIRQGGFAGWLTDGTPLWVSGSGTSKTVLTRYATALNQVLPVPQQVTSGQCVLVDLFARYPLKKVTQDKSTKAVPPGVLNGRYRVMFANGNHITFVSHGETTLLAEKGKLKLQSHLDREEYVARVLDREAKSTPRGSESYDRGDSHLFTAKRRSRRRLSDHPGQQRHSTCFCIASLCWRADDDRLDAGSHLRWRSGSLSRQSRYRRDALLATRYRSGGAGGTLRPDTFVCLSQ